MKLSHAGIRPRFLITKWYIMVSHVKRNQYLNNATINLKNNNYINTVNI